MESRDSRLVVAANRLPATIKRKESHDYEYVSSSGGLATGLRGLAKSKEFLWFGWPGMDIPEEDQESVEKYLRQHYSAAPIFLEDRLAQLHYNGFSSEFSLSQKLAIYSVLMIIHRRFRPVAITAPFSGQGLLRTECD